MRGVHREESRVGGNEEKGGGVWRTYVRMSAGTHLICDSSKAWQDWRQNRRQRGGVTQVHAAVRGGLLCPAGSHRHVEYCTATCGSRLRRAYPHARVD